MTEKTNCRRAHLLKETYQLARQPVAVKFLSPEQDNYNIQPADHRNTVCSFIQEAAGGGCFAVDESKISCPGGLKWLGFPSPLADSRLYKFFLGNIEKVKCSTQVAEKLLECLPQPPREGTYEQVLFAPLDHCPYQPDITVLVTNPKQAYRIIVTAHLDDCHFVKTVPLCAACHGSITVPLITGELNVSMIDPEARRFGNYNDADVLVGIPQSRLERLIANLKETPFGQKKETLLAKIIRGVIRAISENKSG